MSTTTDPRCYVCGSTPEDCDCECGPVACECDTRYECRVHGEHGILAQQQREREATEEAAFWSVISEF